MRFFAVVFFAVLWAQPLMAQNLAERQYLRDAGDRIASEQGAIFERDCGFSVPVTLDPNLAAPFMEDHAAVNGYCGEVISAMRGMCRDDETSKAMIAARIRSLECFHDAEDREGRYELTDEGVLKFYFNNNTSNITQTTVAFLGETLSPDNLNLEQRQRMNVWQAQVEREASRLEERCEFSVAVSLDDAFAAPFMEAHTSAGGYCASVLSSIWGMCQDDMAREALSESLRRVECVYDAEAEQGGFELREDGTFRFSFSLGTSNISRIVAEYLRQAL